jgi:hypothetical protein
MLSEDRAARIVYRLLPPTEAVLWEEFERILVSQQRPDWNQAVAYVADEIRAAVETERARWLWLIWSSDEVPDFARVLDAMRQVEEADAAACAALDSVAALNNRIAAENQALVTEVAALREALCQVEEADAKSLGADTSLWRLAP